MKRTHLEYTRMDFILAVFGGVGATMQRLGSREDGLDPVPCSLCQFRRNLAQAVNKIVTCEVVDRK